MKRPPFWFALLAGALLGMRLAPPSNAQEAQPIRILETSVDNGYPDSLTFNVSVEGDSRITKAFLFYNLQGDSSTRQPIDFSSSKRVDLEFTWNTSQFTVAPSSPVLFHWQFEDEEGNKATSEEETVYYDDLRFDWNELSDDELIVRWYQGGPGFGEFIYDTAREALTRMKRETDKALEFPVFVLLYANDQDFASWHFFVDDWVGGQAYPSLGITTQIIGADANEYWVRDVIPHEIAHLFFFQVMYTRLAYWPSWFSEGLAQRYEFGNNEYVLQRAVSAAQEHRLLPLSSLSGSFGRDPEQVRLSYAQSLSAVTYLMETWGETGLQALIEQFRKGTPYRLAVPEALGVSWEEFEAGWITWMGVPATPAPPPTATSTMALLQPPSGWPTPTRLPTVTQEATEEPTLGPTPTEEVQSPDDSIPCLGGLIALLLPAGTTWLVRRRKRATS